MINAGLSCHTLIRNAYIPGQSTGLSTRCILRAARFTSCTGHHQVNTRSQPRLLCSLSHGGLTRKHHRGLVCQATRDSTTTVIEYLLLLKAKSDAPGEDLIEMLDSLWSLQYVIPNIICASVGEVISSTGAPPCTLASQSTSPSSTDTDEPLYTHVMHYRLSNRPSLDQFLVHPIYQKLRSYEVEQFTCATAEVVYEGTTDNELMSIFRRGEEYETGLDYFLFMQPSANMDLQGAQVFMRKLAQLSQSSAAGGVQCSYGTTLSSVHCYCSHVMAVRFSGPEHVRAFSSTPAVTALLQHDARLPLLCTTSITSIVEPAQTSSSRPT